MITLNDELLLGDIATLSHNIAYMYILLFLGLFLDTKLFFFFKNKGTL